MSTKEYFKIGSQVNYLRHDNKLEVFEESGTLRAIFLNPDGRLMAQVKNGEEAYNVHYATLFHGGEMIKEYKDLLQDIRSTAGEGDDKASEVVAEYAKLVDGLTTALMGEVVEIEEIEETDLITTGFTEIEANDE